jgi:hypothetical protein
LFSSTAFFTSWRIKSTNANAIRKTMPSSIFHKSYHQKVISQKKMFETFITRVL